MRLLGVLGVLGVLTIQGSQVRQVTMPLLGTYYSLYQQLLGRGGEEGRQVSQVVVPLRAQATLPYAHDVSPEAAEREQAALLAAMETNGDDVER